MLKLFQKKKLIYIYVTLKKMSIVEKGISLLSFVIYFTFFFSCLELFWRYDKIVFSVINILKTKGFEIYVIN